MRLDVPSRSYRAAGRIHSRRDESVTTIPQPMTLYQRKPISQQALKHPQHSLALGFMVYDFVRIHGSLRMSPAMAAGSCSSTTLATIR